MLTPEQRRMRDALTVCNWDAEQAGAPFYAGGDSSDSPPNKRPGMVREGMRLSKLSDSDSLDKDDAYSLRAVYLTFCEKHDVQTERLLLEYPKVIAEHAHVFVIQTADDRARLFDLDSLMIFPEGSLQRMQARLQYEKFSDDDGSVLALFKDLVKDE